jgi:hypothetical protein
MTQAAATQIVLPPHPPRGPALLVVATVLIAAVGAFLLGRDARPDPLPPAYEAPTYPAWMMTPPPTPQAIPREIVAVLATAIPTPPPTPGPVRTSTPRPDECETPVPGEFCEVRPTKAPTRTPTPVAVCPVESGGCFWPTSTMMPVVNDMKNDSRRQ